MQFNRYPCFLIQNPKIDHFDRSDKLQPFPSTQNNTLFVPKYKAHYFLLVLDTWVWPLIMHWECKWHCFIHLAIFFSFSLYYFCINSINIKHGDGGSNTSGQLTKTMISSPFILISSTASLSLFFSFLVLQNW